MLLLSQVWSYSEALWGEEKKNKKEKHAKEKGFKVKKKQSDSDGSDGDGSDSESSGLVVCHAQSVGHSDS